MSKKNKKDKELDIILEQLKKSYGTESSNEIEDMSYEVSKSEEDLELSAVLSKLFSEEVVENDSEDGRNFEDVNVIEAVIADEDEEISIEHEIPDEDEEIVAEPEFFEKDEDITEIFDKNEDNLPDEEVSAEETEFAVEDEEYDIAPDSTDDRLEITDDLQINVEPTSNSEYGFEEDTFEETEAPFVPEEIKPILILDPINYVRDELQEGLPKFKHISFSSEQPAIDSDADTEIDIEDQEIYDDNDISLLLKLGYDDEIKSKVGEEKTHNAILESNSDFVAEHNKKPYGFCGKELTDRNQIPRISQKYQSEKKSLIVMLASVFVLFLMIASITVYFDCYSTRTESFPILLFIELVLIALVAFVLHKKLFAGITGILKFDPDQYSILAFVMSIYALYDVLALIIYAINHKSMQMSDFSLFGTCVALYSLLTVAADLVTCLKEASAFALIASSNKLFTAESIDPDVLNHYHNEKTYKIRKATLISGYFKKTAQSKAPSANLIYIMGVVPLIALIMGCAFAISTGNLMNGITSATVAVFLCIPLSCVCIFPFHEHIISTKLASNKIALIGYDAAYEYSKTQNVIFKDRDVVSLSSYSEIQPQNSSGNNSLNIAHEVFHALNGTISSLGKIQQTSKAKDIVINSITDNGIDLTYSASTNILFGDKNYMKAHNIKVKTDSALHGATKGTDRSVLYMAFDGIPKLGFILGSSINPKFIRSTYELEQCGVKVFVESYEPHINDVYFEQNTGERISIGVFKPKDQEFHVCNDIVNSKVVSASSSFHLSNIVRTAQEIVRQRNICKYINYGLMITGLVLSCLLSLVINSDTNSIILDFIKTHSSLILNVGLLLGLVPIFVTLLKFKERIVEPKNSTLKTEIKPKNE